MARGRPKGSKKVTKPEENTKLIAHFDAPKEEVKATEVVVPVDPKKQELLKKVALGINKTMGDGTLRFASMEEAKGRAMFNIPLLDGLCGGVPYSAVSVLWGNKSCAKTTLTYLLVAQAQRQGKICGFFDLEGSFDGIWAQKMGVDMSKLLLGRFQYAEQAMDALINLAQSGAVDMIVIDSIHSLSPKGEQVEKKTQQKSVEDDTMALLARKLSQFFRMANGGVFKNKVCVLMIGQARTDLGAFIKIEKLTGGKALAHYATIILKARRGQGADAPKYEYVIRGEKGKTKKESVDIGFDLVVSLEKTKISGTAVEGADVHIPFYFNSGFVKPDEQTIKELYLKDILEEEKIFEELEQKEKEDKDGEGK